MDNFVDELNEIYILLCRSALNKEYYGRRLARTQLLSAWSDIFIAIGTTGSGISGALSFIFSTQYGKYVWGVLTVISATIALTKPVVQLNREIERLSKLFVGHSDNYTNLLVVISRIKRHGAISEDLRNSFESAEIRFVELSKEDDPKPDPRILEHCERLIRERHPPDEAWYPATTQVSELKVRE